MLTRLDAEQFPAKVAAEVKDFDIEKYIEKKEARKMDRFTQYAVAASIMAVEDAKLNNYRRKCAIVLVYGLVLVLVEWKHMKTISYLFRKRCTPCKSIFCTNDDSRYGSRSSIDSFRCERH